MAKIQHPPPGKNCWNCAALEWIEAEVGDPSGWVCNERRYRAQKDEERHLKQLEKESYLDRAKRCFVPKTEENPGITWPTQEDIDSL